MIVLIYWKDGGMCGTVTALVNKCETPVSVSRFYRWKAWERETVSIFVRFLQQTWSKAFLTVLVKSDGFKQEWEWNMPDIIPRWNCIWRTTITRLIGSASVRDDEVFISFIKTTLKRFGTFFRFATHSSTVKQRFIDRLCACFSCVEQSFESRCQSRD